MAGQGTVNPIVWLRWRIRRIGAKPLVGPGCVNIGICRDGSLIKMKHDEPSQAMSPWLLPR